MDRSGIYIVSHKALNDEDESKTEPEGGVDNPAFKPEARYREKEGLQLNLNSPYNEQPYRGMGKEDLLRHSSKPLWRRLRFVCISIVLLGWLALIITVVVLVLVYPRCRNAGKHDWWQKDVVYRVYVPSFQDSDNDGWGDIQGLLSRLDYLEKIGVGTISLSPIYKTASGSTSDYDIVDHNAIDSRFGNVNDFKTLINETHSRGMHLIMDFIPGVTSKHHAWFQESSNSSDNPRKKYYVWEEGNGAGPPNNWLQMSGGSAWTNTTARAEFYLHQFDIDLPNLNLRSAEVKDELKVILQYWLSEGVDGFYIRESGFLFEDYDMRDESPANSVGGNMNSYNSLNHEYTYGLPEVYDMLARWRFFLDEYGNKTGSYKLLFADISGRTDQVMHYYGYFNRDGVDFPLNNFCLDLRSTDNGTTVSRLVQQWMDNMPAGRWANWMAGYDNSERMLSRLDANMTRAFMMLSMLLPGTPFYYYGDEIGMMDSNINPGNGLWFRNQSMRSPMQWDNTSYAGFINETLCSSSCSPWTSVNPDKSTVSVQYQSAIYDSTLNLFKNLTALRKKPSFVHGDYFPVLHDDHVFSFVREFDGEEGYLVAINFGETEAKRDYSARHGTIPGSATVELTTANGVAHNIGASASGSALTLGPRQGVVVSWKYVAKEL